MKIDLNELERIAKAATQDTWEAKSIESEYPECDDFDYWADYAETLSQDDAREAFVMAVRGVLSGQERAA